MESFIESEIPYLEKNYKKIVIVTGDVSSEKQRKLSNNVEIVRQDRELGWVSKLLSIRHVFGTVFWKEMVKVKDDYGIGITLGIIKTALISLSQGLKNAKMYGELKSKYSENEDITFYSYWSNDSAIGISLLSGNDRKIVRVHGSDLYFEQSEIRYLPYRSLIGNNIDLLCVISATGYDYVVNRWKTDPNKVRIARLGVESSISKLTTKKNREEMVLVSCSNILPVKRLELVVDGLTEIKGLKIRWVHCGGGKGFESLKKYAFDKLEGLIEYELKGFMANSDVVEMYNEINPDLFINVSSSEGIPVSIMEAMSLGIPCVATAVGGTPEIVNCNNGFLLEKNPSPKDIAGVIMTYEKLLINEKEVFQRAAWNTWNSDFNAEKNYTLFTEEMLVK